MAAQSQSLKFKQPLLKVASNSELTKRLKALHDELRDFDQDLIDPSSLDKVARELVHPSLLLHKDKAVKAFTGCCLVDVLRLYAPEAPYTQAQLQSLFEFLVRQFKKVGDPKDPHQSEYYYIVDSLATVKSVVLVCDLESGSEKLVEQIFEECFNSIGSSSPRNVEIALSDILLSLIEELPSLHHRVVEILVSFFQPKIQRSRPAAFDLAVEVCRGSSDKLQRYVSQYFAEVIQAAIEGKEDSDESDEESEDSEEERARRKKKGAKGKASAKGKGKGTSTGDDEDVPQALVAAHEMIENLNRHVPSLLLNVIPLLSSELTSTASPKYRRLATTCLGDMFANQRGAGDLAASFPLVWKEWTKRMFDVTPTVRIAVAGCLRKIWVRHAELGSDIEAVLNKLLGDTDEKVRIAACQVFEAMDYETACHHVSSEMLKALGDKTVDRKEKVRQIAYRSLGRLFNLAYTELEAREEQACQQFGWIPGALLDGITFTDGSGSTATQVALVDQTFSEFILPLPSSESTLSEDIPAWVDRFLQVERLLEGPPSLRKALMHLTRLQEGRSGAVWNAYIEVCEVNNGGIIDDKEKEAGIKEFLNKTIKTIASKMPDPIKAQADLKTFAKQNQAQLYRELKVLLDPQTDLKTYIKNHKDLMRRLEKMSDSVASTFSSFIRLSCYTTINRSSIPQLLKRLVPTAASTETEDLSASARRTLEFVSKTRPILYKSHVAELTKIVMATEKDANPDSSESAIGTALHALAKLKVVDGSFAVDSKLSKRAVSLAKEAKTVDHAKYAATLIALDRTRTGTADDLVEFLADALPEDLPEDLVPHLASLARISMYGQDSFETKSEQISSECVKVLRRDTRAAEMSKEEGATWIEDSDLHPLTSARLLALKVLTNRCIPFANTESSPTVAEPVMKMLWHYVESGRRVDEEETVVSSRIRLAATLGVLKLLTTKDPVFVKSTFEHFALLSRTAQDTCFEVRDGYLQKLLQYLRAGRLHKAAFPHFHMSLFLIAHEPEEDLRLQVVHFIKTYSRRPDRQATWELPFVRLLSLLAHHPDFEGEHSIEEYRLMAKYFDLYLDCIATNENISLLYHLAQLVKGARDKESSEFDNNLYTLSELAQHLIKAFAERHNWPLTTLPKSHLAIKLPGDTFKSIADSAKAREIGQTVYLSEEILKELDVKEKKVGAPRKRKAVTSEKQSPKKKRVSKAGVKKSTAKKRKSGQEWDSSQSEGEEEPSEEEEEGASDAGEKSETSAKGKVVTKKKSVKKVAAKEPTRKGLRGRAGRKSMKEVDEEDEEEEEDEGASSSREDAMSVDEEVETPKKQTKAKKVVSKSTKSKTPPSKSKKKTKEPDTRRAVRGLTQPRAIKKKADLEQVSDVEDSDTQGEAEEGEEST
ncbi:sister chromatid cohesion factor PDS5 [Sporobolomyces salmoneus]|uniref:sister chromatid cohesion factor PDS5 n=1 Tax=Sporobolomyces salmoneus TaxID=183962 RepID=UPI00317A93E5